MEKLLSYEQYSQVLAAFKEGWERCGTNKLMTREELTNLIEAGKLWYEQVGDTLWFFTHEGYFYTGVYYVPADKAIEMQKQDMDVVAELMGKGDRYDQRRDDELVAAGFEKRDKRLEFCTQLEESIELVKKENEKLCAYWGRKGFTCRTATRADYPETYKLWLDRLGKERYTAAAMTDTEIDDMERFGRCIVICDKDGHVQAAENYEVKKGNSTACYFHLFASYMLGMGGWADRAIRIQAYQEGFTKGYSWIRDDNVESRSMASGTGLQLTGKFYWQFVCPAEKSI